jgi:hypothetical protein
MIACLAIIARDNSPFYFKASVFTDASASMLLPLSLSPRRVRALASPSAQVVRAEEEASMTLHYIVHTSIDVFEEKVCTPSQRPHCPPPIRTNPLTV